MHAATFTRKFRKLTTALEACDRKSQRTKTGIRTLDSHLTELADLYWEVSETQQQRIRDEIDPDLAEPLLCCIHRFAILIADKDDLQWFRRGLAIAAIQNGRCDYRDFVIALVILRHGAERVGIKTRKHFNDTVKAADKTIHDYLKNARDHRESDVKLTVGQFGPPEWRRKRRS